MSSAERPLHNATEAYVTSKRPKMNRSNVEKVWVSANSDNTRYAYLYFTLPFDLDTNVVDAKLTLYNTQDEPGSITVTAQRISEKWNAGRVNWSNKPAVVGGGVSVTKSSPGKNSKWEFNVTGLLSAATAANKWWGIRISTTSNGAVGFFTAQANNKFRPQLHVTWTDAPDAPEDVNPRGNRAVSSAQPIFYFDFTDDSGNTELNAASLKFNSSNAGWNENDGFTSFTYDTGTRYVSEPQVNLAEVPGAPSFAAGVQTWWTVKVQDGAGEWSKWSEPVSFRYVPKLSISIDSPGPIVNDPTPTVLLSIPAGTTLTAYKAFVSKVDDPDEPVWKSGKISTSEIGFELPPKVIRRKNFPYRLTVMAWDAEDRERNGDQKIYAEDVQDFVFQPSSTVATVSSLRVTQTRPWPWVTLSWARSTAADEYNIYRDDELIEANIPATEVFVSGTSYEYIDRMASPRVSHTWAVEAVVNKVSSQPVESQPLQTRLLAPMMMELDATDPVFFLNPSVDPVITTSQEKHQPIAASPVLITQYLGGYEGRLEGVFADGILPGVSARAMKNKFKRWQRQSGKLFYLYLVDEVLKIAPYNMTYRPRATNEGVIYHVGFDFFEVD